MTNTFELTVSKIEEISNRLCKIPLDANLHLPDKPNIYPNLELANNLQNRKLGLTFSLANHYHNGILELIIKDLKQYLAFIDIRSNIDELLIVSGPSQRKIDTLAVLEFLSSQQLRLQLKPDLVISVAYNCNSVDQIKENSRLTQKLKCQLVKKVYIQITDNIEKIMTGINFIQNIDPNITISVCIFEPSKASLARFKLRPWKGVELSQDFLSDIQNARSLNQNNLRLLAQFEIETIWTT